MPGRAGLAPRPIARLSREDAVVDRPRDADAAQRRRRCCRPRRVNVLRTTYTGRPWYCDSARTAPPPRSGPVGSQRLPTNVESHDLEPAAARRRSRRRRRPRTSSPVESPSGERQVLHDEPRRGLVVAVRRGPDLPLVAGVLVEDAALPAAAERDQAAAVEDDAAAGVDHLGGPLHLDPRPGRGPQRNRMIPPLATARTTARDVQLARRAVADPAVGVRGVDRPRRARHLDRRAAAAGAQQRPGTGS